MTEQSERTRTDPPGDDPAAEPTGRRRRPRRRTVVLVLLVAALAWLGQSLGSALTAAGTDSVAARLSEWARFHHLGALVTTAEKVQYDLHPPRSGGTPRGGIPSAAPSEPAVVAAPTSLPAPAALRPVASPALAGEGQWQTVARVGAVPAVREAFVRPDTVHTSYVAGVMWMDPTLLRFQLHPGTEVPGGTGWSQPPLIRSSLRTGLVATFNSGFTMQDAHGGFWESGRQVGVLRPGAASLVIDGSGRPDVTAWGSDPRPAPGIVAVRQNLALLVTGGHLAAGIESNAGNQWGATLGNADFVWRSAVGVTATGALVYVAGPALSALTIAQLEVSAGAVRAMELDINPEWTTAMTYRHPTPADAVPAKLTADEQNSAYRYLQVSTRDFIAAYAR